MKLSLFFKSGKPSSMNNYRSISLLSPLAKVLKKLSSIGLTEFLEENNILADQQLCFLKDHSTTHTDTDFYSQICNNLDNGKHSCALLLDLKKAFDPANHEIFLRELDKYSIRGIRNKLFQNYLSNRSQFVCFNGTAFNKEKNDMWSASGSNSRTYVYFLCKLMTSPNLLSLVPDYLLMTQL